MSTSAAATTDDRVLDPALAMDAVTLRVGDLEGMSSYYVNALALEPLEERSASGGVRRVLGRGGVPLIRLVHTPGLPPVRQTDAGLFHTAFLFDDQTALAATVARAAKDPRSRFAGSSDHLVSEAFYFTDPEGNGIELYVDRPREQWQYDGGQVRMDTLLLDPNEYLRTHLTEDALARAAALPARVGHVHLQVGEIPAARAFYADALGFDPTLTGYPGALFASAGGYHHHVAMNTWNSRGAGPRAARLGLGEVAITLPRREDLDALAERLRYRSLDFADTGRAITVDDPWGTRITVTEAASTTEELLDRSDRQR